MAVAYDGQYFSTILVPMVILGLGVAAFAAPVTTVAMASAGEGRDGLASGVNAVARIGPLLAIAALGFAMASEFEAQMLSHSDFGNLTPVVQDYLRAHMNELGGMVLPTDWQQTDITKGDAIIKESYANTVKFALRILRWHDGYLRCFNAVVPQRRYQLAFAFLY